MRPVQFSGDDRRCGVARGLNGRVAGPHQMSAAVKTAQFDETIKSAPRRPPMSFTRPERDTAGTARHLHTAKGVPEIAQGWATTEHIVPTRVGWFWLGETGRTELRTATLRNLA